MKLKLLLLLFPVCFVYCQESEGSFEIVAAGQPKLVITKEQENAIALQVKSNVALLNAKGIINSGGYGQRLINPLLQWPLQSSSSLFNSTWAIIEYADHDLGYPNQLQDYNCGTKTYDNSDGNNPYFGIRLNPFPYYQSGNNITSIVAAAPGTIVFKDAGNAETSCGGTAGLSSNLIIILHWDGTYAYYYGIKQNTATAKILGDSVAAGEFLGFVGNAGYTGTIQPCLLFKILDTDANGNALIDPFAGSCNSDNTASLWAQQPAYVNSKVNAVFTHSALPNFVACPEATNFKDSFVSPDTVVMAGFMTDMTAGTILNFQLERPDGSFAQNLNITLSNSYAQGYYQFTRNSSTFNQTGIWIARYTYNGTTFQHSFYYNSVLGVNSNDKIINTKLVPNPTSGWLRIESELSIQEVRIVDGGGRIISVLKQNGIRQLDISFLAKGVYFIELRSEDMTTIKKIVRE